MASSLRRFMQSPLRVVLVVHLVLALATGGLVVGAVLAHKADPNADGHFVWLGGQLRAVATGQGGMTLFWTLVIPLALLLAVCLVLGLVYGRWGLPGHLQGRSVYFVPLLSALYFCGGTLALSACDGGSFGAGWRDVVRLVSTSQGLTLVLIYASLSTSAAGLGWAVALAVTQIMRRRGKWETIGFVQQKA
jgi:hypothetical protein